MSLSDNNSSDFRPFDVGTLDRYDSEMSLRTGDTPADLERFKLLFEKSAFERSPEDEFKALYTPPEQKEEVFFVPLIKERKKKLSGKEIPVEVPRDMKVDGEPAESVKIEPEETAEEKGFKTGYDKGYAEGQSQGVEQGYQEGHQKGYDEGFLKGEPQGLEQGKTKGYEKGYEEGLRAGQQEARQEGLKIIQSLEQSIETVNNMVPQLLLKYEDRIINMIEKICYKAVQATIEMDDEVVKPLIMDTMNALVEPEEIELTVSEADYEYIEMVKDDFFEKIDTLQHITVRSDSLLPKGGCKIQTRTATVQTDPKSRLEAIFEAIKQTKMM